ncbi:OLC1v1030359C1 [Oldenlandia corymbosa var. corymbosa]|uniref:OLC1v1030359C1 n=1 Tax=Oldenlandia corymbosa var. corymbosa TaxID=529605 RepID=A0AAV1CGX0_OLDCO|nr:OLC1v1030359C1 [Oldenlandia corymbosa var. corymbosa]
MDLLHPKQHLQQSSQVKQKNPQETNKPSQVTHIVEPAEAPQVETPQVEVVAHTQNGPVESAIQPEDPPVMLLLEDQQAITAEQQTIDATPEQINEVNVQQVSAAQKDAKDSLGEHQAIETFVATQLNTATETLGAAATAAQPVSVVSDNPMIETEKSISLQSSSMAAKLSMVELRRESQLQPANSPRFHT